MEFLPQQNQSLVEVKPKDLKKKKEYLIEFTSYDNKKVNEKGTFVGRKDNGAFSKFILSSTKKDAPLLFQNTRSKFYNHPSSGGKRIKKQTKRTTHRKRKQTRKMK
jgi:hypothetical protein